MNRQRKWDQLHPEYRAVHRAKERKRHADARAKILEFLGGFCVTCKFADSRALHVDHINGLNGNKRRRTAVQMWGYIQGNVSKARSEFQLLCANCNFIKAHDNPNEHSWNKKVAQRA